MSIHSYVLPKLYKGDLDLRALPFDSPQMYIFEGGGSVAVGSLSSLQSATSVSEQSFDFLPANVLILAPLYSF